MAKDGLDIQGFSYLVPIITCLLLHVMSCHVMPCVALLFLGTSLFGGFLSVVFVGIAGRHGSGSTNEAIQILAFQGLEFGDSSLVFGIGMLDK
eukprot:scaffold55991_cov37-Attheya_sp.AAC.1